MKILLIIAIAFALLVIAVKTGYLEFSLDIPVLEIG